MGLQQISRQVIISGLTFMYFVNEQHLHVNNSVVISWWFLRIPQRKDIMLKLQVQVLLQLVLVQPALIASMAWASELLEKIVKNCSMYSGGKESALGFALFCRKSPCCFKVFVNYFFLIAGQTWLIFTVFHCIFTLSLQSWKKNSQSEDAKWVILFSSRPHPNLCSNMQ